MTVALPEILRDPQYEGQWEFKEWKPVAKPGTPKELCGALRQWVREVEAAERELRRFSWEPPEER